MSIAETTVIKHVSTHSVQSLGVWRKLWALCVKKVMSPTQLFQYRRIPIQIKAETWHNVVFIILFQTEYIQFEQKMCNFQKQCQFRDEEVQDMH